MIKKVFTFFVLFLMIPSLCFSAYINDGVDDFLDSSFIPVSGSTNRTVIIWLYPTSFNSGGAHFIEWGTQATGERYSFKHNNSVGDLRIELQGDGYSSSLTLQANQWNCAGVVLDGTTLGDHTLYLDGSSESATGSLSVNTGTSTNLSVGRGNADVAFNSRNFVGTIGPLAIWNTALTSAEVGEACTKLKRFMGTQVQPSSIVGAWTLDDVEDGQSADGATFYDYSGNDNNLTGDNGANNTGLTATADTNMPYPPS